MQTAVRQAGRLISRFLAWWLGELGAFVPGPLRRAVAGESGLLAFEAAGGELVMSRSVGGVLQGSARIDLDQPDDALRAAVARTVAAHGRRSDDLLLVMAQGEVLHKTLDLPQAAEEGLGELLYFELDRQTPYRPEEVRFDYRVVGRDRMRGRMNVELVVAPIEAIDRIEARAAAWGLGHGAVTVAGIDDIANPAFDLSGGRKAAPSGAGGTILISLLALLAAGLLWAAVWLPLEAQRQAAEEAAAVTAEARKAALAATELRDELDRRSKEGSFLIRRKGEAAMMTAVLADLSRLLPDDTWLFELHVRGDEVRARGYAPAASTVLELIERGPGFRNARFSSPVTRVPGVDAERFDLTFELARPQEAKP